MLYSAYAPRELRDAVHGGSYLERLDRQGANLSAVLRTRPTFPLPRTVEFGAGRSMGALLRMNHPDAFKRYSSVEV